MPEYPNPFARILADSRIQGGAVALHLLRLCLSPSFQLVWFWLFALVLEENDRNLTSIRKWSYLLHSLLLTVKKIYSVFGESFGAPEVSKSFLHLVGQAKVAGKRCSNLSVSEHTVLRLSCFWKWFLSCCHLLLVDFCFA